MAHRFGRQIETGHRHQGFDSGQGVTAGIGMHGRQGPIMTGIHGLQHIQALGSSDLAQNNLVRTHAEGILHELTLRDLTFPFDIRRPCLQTNYMVLTQLQFGGVFDRYDAFIVRNKT